MKPFSIRATMMAAAVACAAPASATILTFDIDNSRPADILAMDQNYGDRVTALVQGNASYGVGTEGFTPNVTLGYQPATASLTRWTTGFGDLVNVYENEDDGDTLVAFTLTADAGYQAILYGLDLGGYFGDYTVPGITVLADGVQVFGATNYLVRGSGAFHSTLNFARPLIGSTIQFRIDLTGLDNNSDNIGIDNVRFGQSQPIATTGVPEPATWAMMIAGFGFVGGAMRRRREAPAAA